jgi:sulfide:quinone oxidoreductase
LNARSPSQDIRLVPCVRGERKARAGAAGDTEAAQGSSPRRAVAADIAATIEDGGPPAPYEGSGVCYAEFAGGLVSKVEFNFLRGDAPAAERYSPSREYAAEKEEFGAVRRKRWFGRVGMIDSRFAG